MNGVRPSGKQEIFDEKSFNSLFIYHGPGGRMCDHRGAPGVTSSGGSPACIFPAARGYTWPGTGYDAVL
jgi:hypothetical protein